MATTTTTELVGVLASYASANLALSFINKAIARSPSVNYGILLLVQCLATVGYLACFGGRRPIRRAWAVAVFPSCDSALPLLRRRDPVLRLPSADLEREERHLFFY